MWRIEVKYMYMYIQGGHQGRLEVRAQYYFYAHVSFCGDVRFLLAFMSLSVLHQLAQVEMARLGWAFGGKVLN